MCSFKPLRGYKLMTDRVRLLYLDIWECVIQFVRGVFFLVSKLRERGTVGWVEWVTVSKWVV